MITTKAQINAFEAAKKNFGTNEERILNFIKGLQHHGATKKQLERVLDMKHQTLTSRLSALQDKGLIFHDPKEEPVDGCTNWYATPNHLIDHHIELQADLKFLKWLVRGKKQFGIPDNLVVQITQEYQYQRTK